jgi:hypothetical protein
VSVTFYARRDDGTPIRLDIEHPAYLNLASVNARAFLEFLGIVPGEEPSGEVSIHEARRAVIRARPTFERRVGAFVRLGSDTQRPGEVRVIVGGIGGEYFGRRLTDFERFLVVVTEMRATVISWG